MNENFNTNAKVKQLTKVFLSREEKKALSLKILYNNDLEVFEEKLYWFWFCFERKG